MTNTAKSHENAVRTLHNFTARSNRLKVRHKQLTEKISDIAVKLAKKQKRTDHIRERPATKQSTIDNNEKYIEKRRIDIEKRNLELRSLDQKIQVLNTKIEKKTQVVEKLQKKMSI